MNDVNNSPEKEVGISCKEAMSKLYQYLDSQLDDISDKEIEKHVHDCRECFSRVDFEKSLRSKVLQSASIETPLDVQHRLKSLIEKF